MFSVVSGSLLAIERDHVIVNVNGLGLEVQVTETYASEVTQGEVVILHTVFQKRQDEMSLTGFASRDELELFILVMETPGVGAKMARSALGVLGYDGLIDAIRRGNEPALRKIPGIGPRAAAMLLVTLRPKLGDSDAPNDETQHAEPSIGASASERGEALAALQGLGWKKRDAVSAIETAVTAVPPPVSVEGLIRAALATLQPRR